MSLFAIGDLHLSLSADKPMDIFGSVWRNHPQKLMEGFSALTAEDTCVLCGDLCWGMGIEDCREDFAFIHSLPGKKILVKGNHDYWWSTAAKINGFLQENGFSDFSILHNNCIPFGEYALCGTRGWFYEEEKGNAHDQKLLAREVLRLKASLDAAGDRKKLVFLHYPPITRNYRCEEILALLRDYEVRLCLYGHLHAKSHAIAWNGWYNGTDFHLVSADFLNFKPLNIDGYLYS